MIFKNRLASYLLYALVGLASLFFALLVSSQLTKRSYSQTENRPLSAPPVPPAASAPPSTPPAASAPPSAPPAGEAKTGQEPNGNPGATGESSPAKDILSSQEVSFLEPYVFDMRQGRRNPFRPPIFSDSKTDYVFLPGTPLEIYDIDELKLVGIMWDIKFPKAMFIDPQGEMHILGKDDRIGRKRGYIATIREGEVVVVETTTFNGESTLATRILRIQR